MKSATTLRNRLYCNPGAPFNVRDTESIPLIQAANHTANKEIFVKTEHLSRDVGSPHIKPPIVTMATLIGIATYLAVVGVVHVLSSPDATAAVARDISMSPALTAGASTFSVPPQSEGLPSRSTPNQ